MNLIDDLPLVVNGGAIDEENEGILVESTSGLSEEVANVFEQHALRDGLVSVAG